MCLSYSGLMIDMNERGKKNEYQGQKYADLLFQ